MKFLDYIFYRYYSYLFNKNSVGNDLLKAQFFITFFMNIIFDFKNFQKNNKKYAIFSNFLRNIHLLINEKHELLKLKI